MALSRVKIEVKCPLFRLRVSRRHVMVQCVGHNPPDPRLAHGGTRDDTGNSKTEAVG